MSNDPLVSVIIACHNCESFLDLCIGSLVNQTYHNLEIIICDDASTDRSLEIIRKWEQKDQRIIVLHNSLCQRAAQARNNCIAVSSGSFFLIQDADDYSMPNRVECLLEEFANDPEIDFISSAANLFSSDSSTFDSVLAIKKHYPKKTNFLWGLPFIHASTMFKSECVRDIGGYRVAEETKRGQDYDMFMRLYAKGYKGKNISKPLYCIRADAGYINRQRNDNCHDEFLIRKNGFKLLKLMPLGYFFALKPYFVSFFHKLFRRKQ